MKKPEIVKELPDVKTELVKELDVRININLFDKIVSWFSENYICNRLKNKINKKAKKEGIEYVVIKSMYSEIDHHFEDGRGTPSFSISYKGADIIFYKRRN